MQTQISVKHQQKDIDSIDLSIFHLQMLQYLPSNLLTLLSLIANSKKLFPSIPLSKQSA
ncbi:hypothetical protein GIB67_014944 [Kingdonia uniflora]|uniref:Uncharacterized protein n=1 Tax=Kingdonia uniflora TaxID=39325 RepID=A0A7J7MTP2_9MAGN|nr:hypothetical protein GIB67_014944 [Kingdonia uniflora]